MRRKDRLHPEPLPRPACFYQEDEKYPEMLKQGFSDGTVHTYWAETEMPRPHLMNREERIAQARRCGGYICRKPAVSASGWKKILRKAKQTDEELQQMKEADESLKAFVKELMDVIQRQGNLLSNAMRRVERLETEMMQIADMVGRRDGR